MEHLEILILSGSRRSDSIHNSTFNRYIKTETDTKTDIKTDTTGILCFNRIRRISNEDK